MKSSLKKGGLNLRKWRSNIPSADYNKTNTSNEVTYTKQMFQTSSNEIKIVGVPWNKVTDKLLISIPKFQQSVTKRNILNYVALI